MNRRTGPETPALLGDIHRLDGPKQDDRLGDWRMGTLVTSATLPLVAHRNRIAGLQCEALFLGLL